MGITRAGFVHDAVVEWDADACQTIRENRGHYSDHGESFDLFEGDARTYNYDVHRGKIDVVSGGPPCQPFSMGGKHGGYMDERDMFPVAIESVRRVKPKAFIFENVKGLLRESFASYFEYVTLQLAYPDLPIKKNESQAEHLSRLERIHSSSKRKPTYKILFRLLNAADYGVPQKRERVFIVGIRSDLGIEWSFPDPTHSEDDLLIAKYVTGSYWDKHGIPKTHRPAPPQRLQSRISKLAARLPLEPLMPWQTVRDSISDLPDPQSKQATKFHNHVFNGGARAYPGHTGSPLDEPAKTLKAGVHGVPGGENMLAYPDGTVRYFTVREAARIQTFPDSYRFHGSWSETMRQLGNAVPVRLAEAVSRSVANVLEEAAATATTVQH
ncbi:DNA-cytosine methyltransferase [Caballeronia catudaia]|uniref:DNA (cytosine-5-)-methyltransferase n=2 Tax=Caballeronia catudaia TaxID=1777136 RepID=A0A157Z3H1_9BURK|nr:DNA-cytosine methyltransferase [Caballeronia catudaia]